MHDLPRTESASSTLSGRTDERKGTTPPSRLQDGSVPFPGPIVGLLLLLAILEVRRPRGESPLVQGPQLLLRHLSLLYVPVGVGVVVYLGRLGRDALPVTGGLLLSWLAGLLATAGAAALGLRMTGARKVVR